MNINPRYRSCLLSQFQCRAADRVRREECQRQKEALTKDAYAQWMQDTRPFEPSQVCEINALNECAPKGYRMVAREVMKHDIYYLFEAIE